MSGKARKVGKRKTSAAKRGATAARDEQSQAKASDGRKKKRAKSADKTKHGNAAKKKGVADGQSKETGTRDRIIDAARDLFLEQGYEATGIAQIREKAGVNSGSLYYFFNAKEDLLAAVLEQYKQLMWPVVMEPVFSRLDDPIDRIFGVLAGYRQMLLMTDCTAGCPIGNLALEMSTRSETARRLIGENFENWRGVIRDCFDAAAERFPPDVNRDRLATFVLTTMEGGVMQARTHKSIEPFDAGVEMLRDYIDRLLAAGGK